MILQKITEQEYKKFINKYKDLLFFQSVEWGKFKSKTNWQMEIVGMYDKKKLKAASILLSQKIPLLNKKMYYCPRGYILDYNDYDLIKEYTLNLKKYLKTKDAIFLKINPYVEYQKRDKDGNIIGTDSNKKLVKYLKKIGYKHYGFYKKMDRKKDLEPRWLSVLDISNKSVDQLLKDMRPTTRWMINKSSKNYITILEAKYDDLSDYKRLMEHTAGRRKFKDRPLSYYQTMYNELTKSKIFKLLLAVIDLERLRVQLLDDINKLNDRVNKIINNPKKENQVIEFKKQIDSLNSRLLDLDTKIKKYGNNTLIAGGIYLSYGDQVVYLFGGSYKEFMNYGAQYLMQYSIIKYAKDNNFKKINFYGIDGDFKKNGKNYGLFDFKRGFNADVVELIGEFDLVVNNFYYLFYNVLFKIYKIIKKIKRN